MDAKLYLIRVDVSASTFIAPMPWSTYPRGVELNEGPRLWFHEGKVELTLVVRCDPAIAKEMNWIPLERPSEGKNDHT